MKVLIVHPGPSFSVQDVYRGWIRGLRANGVTVRECRIDADLTVFGACDLTIEGDTRSSRAVSATVSAFTPGLSRYFQPG